jgi:predicted esterase
MKTLIIFLHGSGGTGHDLGKFLGINRYRSFEGKTFIQKAQENGISIITPTAPLQSYSPAFGEKVNVWFDRSPNFIELGRNDIEYDPRFSIQNVNKIISNQ